MKTNLIILVAFFLFGPKKLPELGKAAGKTLREFKKALEGKSSIDASTDQHSEK